MSRQQVNGELKALLAEARWSAGQLAHAVNTLGEAQGLALRYDRSAVAHWLSGSRPRPPVPDLAAQALSRRCGRLVSAGDTGLARTTQARAPLSSMPHGVDAVRQLVSLSRDDAHPGRRAFVARTAYVAAAVTLPVWPAGQSRAAGPAESADRQASSADAEVLQSMSGTFADLADRHGGGHARTALAAYASEDVARLRSAPMSGRLRSELFTGAAQLTHLLAMMTADAGYQRAECESLPDSSLSRAQAC